MLLMQVHKLCAQFTVRPNKPKMSEFGAEKVLLQGYARKTRGSCS